jgi:YARHG domain/Gram-negative bacterial TonB protein C-terminal
MKTKSLAESLAIAGLAPMLLILVSCGGKADDAANPEFKEVTSYARELANSGENCLKVFGKPNAAASVLGSLIVGRCVVALGEEKALAEAIVYTEYEGIQNGLTPDQAVNAAYVLLLQNRRDQLRDVLARSKERNTTPTPSPGAAGTSPTPTPVALFARSPKVPYPPQAMQLHITGRVTVEITVAKGTITNVRATGPDLLASAAEKWIRSNWQAAPTTEGRFSSSVNFVLGSSDERPADQNGTPAPNPSPVSVEQPVAPPSSALSGERYPQTRQRLLTMDDVMGMSINEMRYAINEVYARYGATFPNAPDIQRQFQKFEWYHPKPALTFEEVDRLMSDTEKQNLKFLAHCRELKRSK